MIEGDKGTSDENAAYEQVAKYLVNGQFLLIATGAGFSACSGLPVYNDIANIPVYREKQLSYHDLARPTMLDGGSADDVSLFYGFWISCMKQYRSTVHHPGYQILKKWDRYLTQKLVARGSAAHSKFENRQREFLSTVVSDSSTIPVAQSTFVYTSNVDAHFTKEFTPEQLYEIHGNVFEWQCSDVECANEHGTWSFPLDVLSEITVNQCTMTIEDEVKYHEGTRVFKCKHCNKWTRPNVLLFGDDHWRRHKKEEETYVAWECVVENSIREWSSNASDNDEYPFIVLEMGCGQRVPEVRLECENVVRDARGKSILIRVNASKNDAEHLDDTSLEPYHLAIHDTSLNALQKIDSHFDLLLQKQHQNKC